MKGQNKREALDVLSDLDSLSSMRVRLAKNRWEIEQALKLAHDSYVEKGLMLPTHSGLRLLPQHALPSTNIIVAENRGKVLGTVTLIRDGSFRLPLDTIYDISLLRKPPHRVAELSSLAVHNDLRMRQSHILVPLFKYVYQCALPVFGVDTLVITVNPAHVTFYSKVLGFQRISDEIVKSYDFVNGAPAVGFFVRIPESKEGLRDLCHYMKGKDRVLANFERVDSRFAFPGQKFFSITHPMLNANSFQYFFKRKTNLLNQLPKEQNHLLQQIYFGKPDPSGYPTKQLQPRFEVKCPVSSNVGEGIAQNVSRSGLGIYSKSKFLYGKAVELGVRLGKNSATSLKVLPVWKKENGLHGMQIVESGPDWIPFMEFLERKSPSPPKDTHHK